MLRLCGSVTSKTTLNATAMRESAVGSLAITVLWLMNATIPTADSHLINAATDHLLNSSDVQRATATTTAWKLWIQKIAVMACVRCVPTGHIRLLSSMLARSLHSKSVSVA